MRNKKVLIALCAGGLLMGGCSANQAANKESGSQPSATHTAQAQSNGTLDNAAVSDEPSASADSTTNKNNSSVDNTAKTSGITEQEAFDIALKHANVKESDLTSKHIKKDIEDGKEVYEGEIHYKNKEYEFEIDASTGKILSWEEDDD